MRTEGSGPLTLGDRGMTIQFGNVAIQYDYAGIHCRQLEAVRHLIEKQIKARAARRVNESVVRAIIRRWLVAPALTGMIIGMLIQ